MQDLQQSKILWKKAKYLIFDRLERNYFEKCVTLKNNIYHESEVYLFWHCFFTSIVQLENFCSHAKNSKIHGIVPNTHCNFCKKYLWSFVNNLQKRAPKHTDPVTADTSLTVPFWSTAGNITDKNTFGNPLILISWEDPGPSSNVRHWSAKENNFECF